MTMKWTDADGYDRLFRTMNQAGTFCQEATPADLIACLRANPEAMKVVSLELLGYDVTKNAEMLAAFEASQRQCKVLAEGLAAEQARATRAEADLAKMREELEDRPSYPPEWQTWRDRAEEADRAAMRLRSRLALAEAVVEPSRKFHAQFCRESRGGWGSNDLNHAACMVAVALRALDDSSVGVAATAMGADSKGGAPCTGQEKPGIDSGGSGAAQATPSNVTQNSAGQVTPPEPAGSYPPPLMATRAEVEELRRRVERLEKR